MKTTQEKKRILRIKLKENQVQEPKWTKTKFMRMQRTVVRIMNYERMNNKEFCFRFFIN